jgi:hypothetical protein
MPPSLPTYRKKIQPNIWQRIVEKVYKVDTMHPRRLLQFMNRAAWGKISDKLMHRKKKIVFISMNDSHKNLMT